MDDEVRVRAAAADHQHKPVGQESRTVSRKRDDTMAQRTGMASWPARQAALVLTLLAVLVALLLPSAALATSHSSDVAGNRALVVHDATVSRSDYSTYFTSLEKQGLELTFRSVKDDKPSLWNYDDTAYDHVLLFAPTAKSLPADLSPQKLVSFLERNGNVLFAVSSELTELYRDFAREFDMEFEESGSSLVDHFSAVDNDAKHTTVALPLQSSLTKVDSIFGAIKVDMPFLFKGAMHRLGTNPLLFSLLKPSPTSYSFDTPQGSDSLSSSSLERMDSPDREVVFGSQPDTSLISAFQLLDTERRSADDSPKRKGSAGRAVWIGSTEAFSDDLIGRKSFKTRDGKSYAASSNLAVLTSLTSWLTQQQGILHVEGTSHNRVKLNDDDVRESYEEFDTTDENGQHHIQRMYRIKDTVTFNIDLTQRTPAGWVPAPTDLDLQVSLIMLDPYITTNLTATQPQSENRQSASALTAASNVSPRSTRYSTTFQLPDRHGVYTFVVDWKRHGWTYIHTRDTSPVRPFNHDEHPRGLHSAWPYVTGATTTVLAFLAFCAAWVCSQEPEQALEPQTQEERERKDE